MFSVYSRGQLRNILVMSKTDSQSYNIYTLEGRSMNGSASPTYGVHAVLSTWLPKQ